MYNFEAWDITDDTLIYSGSSKNEMIQEIEDYILNENHIDEDSISEEAIQSLDENELKDVGIRYWINKC